MKLSSNIVTIAISIILVTTSLVWNNTFLALGSTLIIGLLALLNKKCGLIMLIIYFPLRPFIIEINPSLKLIGDLVILFLLIRTVYDSRRNIKDLLKFYVFEYAYFVFCLVGTLSALFNNVDIMALITQLRAYLLIYVVFYVVKRTHINKGDITQFSLLTFVLATLISLHGIVEKISNKTLLMPEAWENWSLSATNQIRVYGLLKGPNELALYLIIAFIVSLYLLKIVEGKRVLIVYFGLTIICTTFLLTYSRGALLCLISFVIVYVLIRKEIKIFLPFFIVLLVSGVLFFSVNKISDWYLEQYVVSDTEHTTDINPEDSSNHEKGNGSNRFKEAFSEETISLSSESGRIFYVKKAIEVFKDYPILGSGFATFGGAATLKYSSPIYNEYGIGYNFYSDNQYILILAETGIFGVLSVMVIAFDLIKITWKRRIEPAISPALIFFVVATVVGSVFYNILENDSFLLYFFFVLGLVLNIYPSELKKKSD